MKTDGDVFFFFILLLDIKPEDIVVILSVQPSVCEVLLCLSTPKPLGVEP